MVGLHEVPGAANMWDLTVGQLHTFVVGAGAYVVHNCSWAGPPATPDELEEGAGEIQEHEPYVNRYSSDYQWDYEGAEGPDRDANPDNHDPAYSMRYYFTFYDEGNEVYRTISANFDPVTRQWENGVFHFSGGK